MQIDPGTFRDRVQILARRSTQEATFGTAQIAWTPIATVWAEVRDLLPSRSENVAEGVTIARRPARIRMRWRDDISSDMRLIARGRTLQIVSGPAMLGNRQYLELMAEEASTMGDAA